MPAVRNSALRPQHGPNAQMVPSLTA